MNVLLIGSGGREHALAWKLVQSPLLEKLFITPGNGGMDELGEMIVLDVSDHKAVCDFCKLMNIALVVIGPEAPLVAGLADDLAEAGIRAFGPSAGAAQLEGSKNFTKALCAKMDIPTAGYLHCTDAATAHAYIDKQGAPIVIKADGLAAGKGVTVAMTLEEAHAAIDDCFEGAFGSAGAEVVIEEFLEGEEASMFFLCDGTNALPFGTAQDHKRVGDGDTGANTGGMGAYSPAPVLTDALQQVVMDEIIKPTLVGMSQTGTPFSGVLYAGLMIGNDGPKLIEYNVRFGDPECQVLMIRLESDLLPILLASAQGDLSGVTAKWRDETALTVVMAAKGYPAAYEKGAQIILPEISDDAVIFHAGTQKSGGDLLAVGGRVLCATASGGTAKEAQSKAYAAVNSVNWPQGFWRKDIGWRAVERES